MIHLLQARAFDTWFSRLGEKAQVKISARLNRIQEHGHFGDIKIIGSGLLELRWRRGIRVYCAILAYQGKTLLLLCGGSKNDQKKDIRKARKILERFTGVKA